MTNCHKLKDKARNEIKAQINEFLLSGGEIEQIKSNERSKPNYSYHGSSLNGDD